jgi:hypothetical protein
MLLWLATVAHAACPQPTEVAEVLRWSNEVEVAFTDRDKGRMSAAAESARSELVCLGERLTPADVATFFRGQGVAAFIQRERSRAIAMFETARELDPDFTFDAEMLSDSHPLRELYESISVAPAAVTKPLADPAGGWLSVNGSVANVVPVGRDYVLQRFDDGGDVLTTWIVRSGDPLPDYPLASDGVEEPDKPADTLSIVVGGGVLVVPNDTDSQVFGAASATVLVPLADAISLDVHVGNGIGGYTDAANERYTLNLPYARVGARFWLSAPDAELRPFIGVGYLSALHGAAGEALTYTPGGGANAGVRTTLSDQVTLDIDAQFGLMAPFDESRSSPTLQSGLLMGLGYRF